MNEFGFRSDSSGRLQRSPIPGDETDADIFAQVWQFTEYTMTCAKEGSKIQSPPSGATHGRDKNFDMAARCWDSLNVACRDVIPRPQTASWTSSGWEKSSRRGGVHPFVIRPSRDRCKFVGPGDLHGLPLETGNMKIRGRKPQTWQMMLS